MTEEKWNTAVHEARDTRRDDRDQPKSTTPSGTSPSSRAARARRDHAASRGDSWVAQGPVRSADPVGARRAHRREIFFQRLTPARERHQAAHDDRRAMVCEYGMSADGPLRRGRKARSSSAATTTSAARTTRSKPAREIDQKCAAHHRRAVRRRTPAPRDEGISPRRSRSTSSSARPSTPRAIFKGRGSSRREHIVIPPAPTRERQKSLGSAGIFGSRRSPRPS